MSETEQEVVLKAHFAGRDGTEISNILETNEDTKKLFGERDALDPPLDPMTLAHLFEMSGALRSNIDAYCTNIDSYGHMFAPVFDLTDDETAEKVKQAMIEERILGEAPDSLEEQAKRLLKNEAPNIGQDGEPTGENDEEDFDIVEPTDAEVQARINEISREMTREKMRLERFFEFCCVDESFSALRMKTRQDLELLGNAYWEVLRNANGDIVQFAYLPSHTVRLMAIDSVPEQIEMPVRATLITESQEVVSKRFRRFIQISDSKDRKTVYFKEFGDPRTVSSVTGKYYKDQRELNRAEGGDGQDVVKATEIIHFKVHNSRSPYGVPRWISEMLSVMGNRHADQLNLGYFQDSAIPPMIVAVSGGRLADDEVGKLQKYMSNELKGSGNRQKIGIISASTDTPTGLGTGTVKIEVIKLRDVQQQDGMFLEYRENNTDAVGMAFRMPRLLRGDIRDFNRASAQSALEFAEQQVFAPLRKEFDFIMNRKILADFGVRFYRFESNGPDFTDPNDLLTRVSEASKAGYATPNELREIASKGFKTELPPVESPWGDERPLVLTMEALRAGRASPEGEAEEAPEPAPMPAPGEQPPGKDEDPKAQEKRARTPVEMAQDLLNIRDEADLAGLFDSFDAERE